MKLRTEGIPPGFTECEVIEELDDGRTGTNFDRSGVQRLLNMAQSGKINCIVVKDLSRWGRSYLEVGDYLEQKFPEWGVRFISINDMYDSAALNGATGGIDLAFKNLIYDLYSQDLSEKVRSGKDTAARSGNIASSYPLYGYDKDKNDKRRLVVDPEDSLIVKRIFDLAEQGNGIAEIVRILNADNTPTMQTSKQKKGYKIKWGKGAYWGTWVVKRILHDERYTGKWIWGQTRVKELGRSNGVPAPRSEWIIVPGAIPAIISDEQFERVQSKLSERSKNRTGKHKTNRTLFKRKVRCADCGRTMLYRPRKEGFSVFLCNLHELTGWRDCSTGKIEEADLHDIVLTLIRQQAALAEQADLRRKENTKVALTAAENIESEIQGLRKLVEKAKTSKMTLWEQYRAGNLSKEAFQAEGESITKQTAMYNDAIAELEAKLKTIESSTGEENIFVERYRKQMGIGELTQSVVDEFINEVIVYAPGRIEIVLNYADEYLTIAGEGAE